MRNKCFTLGLFLFIAGNVFSQVTIFDTISSGGLPRNFRVYVPAIYDGTEAVPLVLNLHGYTSDALGQDLYANFRLIADTANFILVIPNGTFDAIGNRYWNCFIAPGTGVDDVAFLSNLIDSVSADFNIDPNRIYSTGMSNGGFMSQTLACELSNKIAAIADVAGTMDVARVPFCNAAHPTPVMMIHGTADETVPYDGTFDFLPVDDVINYWVDFNGCNTTPVFTEIPDIVASDDCTAEHYVYGDCNNNVNVELFKIIDGGHTWPGTALTFLGVTNLDINACKEIWWFFNRYRLNELVGVNEIMPTEKINLSPNPAKNLIQISIGDNKISAIEIYDIQGKIIITENKLNNNTFICDTQNFVPGTYFVKLQSNGIEFSSTFIKE